MKELLSKLEKQYELKIPFVLYALPDSRKITCFLQEKTKSFSLDEKQKPAFVFQPFNKETRGYSIPREGATMLEAEFDAQSASPKSLETHNNLNEKEAYEHLVKKARSWIEQGKCLKIVTSRRHVEKLKSFQLEQLINSLFSLYPTAFRYIWFHPETGLWCGATPELLLESDGECFNTMALAGTQFPDSAGRVVWSEKEKEEQQIVVDDITDKLQKVLSVIKISKTVNHVAGSVVHLRTDISGCIKKGKNTLFDIVHTLHPTPAVCGTPMSKARKFIDLYEGYDREFYTGYLGILGAKEEDSGLYVNLRCMKIEKGMATIYVGGGITGGSEAAAEWHETENKLQTMLQVLQPFL